MDDEISEFDRLNEALAPKPLPWQDFESEVAAYLDDEIKSLGIDPATSRVMRKPKYFSKIRESEIEFDASVEVWPVANADKPTVIWLWECKDYPSRNVDVSEIEEFHDKMRQVGAHKGTVATRKGFAKGAVTAANSYGIALITLNKRQVSYLAFSRDAGVLYETEIRIAACIHETGREEFDLAFDTFLYRELETQI
ncbi:hypothetical protein CA51_49890 [Rosistilla oblonga]|uniref:restriction endonuclease n=1 Tax=Rosistilla oblonga TaxID=2527990 RepID=UPI00118C7CD9|nr:restriction endonuclease [Rosistilla oblonga]QDV15078.1 hypothetical protein CA51_49890 [Rosistilla oblonga]